MSQERKVTPKPCGLSSEGLTLLSASVSPSGREALVPAETEHWAEGPSAEETLSSTDRLHSAPGCLACHRRGSQGLSAPGVGHDVVLCHMHIGLGSSLKYFAFHVYQIHQEPTCLPGVRLVAWGLSWAVSPPCYLPLAPLLLGLSSGWNPTCYSHISGNQGTLYHWGAGPPRPTSNRCLSKWLQVDLR